MMAMKKIFKRNRGHEKMKNETTHMKLMTMMRMMTIRNDKQSEQCKI